MQKHLGAQAILKEEDLEDLVHRSLRGETRAWTKLWEALAPLVEGIARRASLTGPLARRAEERCSIVVRFMGELRAHRSHLLVELGEQLALRDGSYRPWLSRIAINAAITHVRRHPDYLGKGARRGTRWASLVALEDALVDPCRAPLERIEACRILQGAREVLDPAQLEALCRWLQGDDFDEIAAALHLDGGAPAAMRLVHSGVERLRFRFARPNRSGDSAPTSRPAPKKIDRGV